MIGQTISHYTILEKLGEGGMGVVYKAHDTRLDRTVALKFLSPALSASKHNKDRFIREARTASALEHSNICTIHEIDQTADGQIYIVMPAYEGVPLNEKIAEGPLKLDQAIDIALQITDGLQASHGKGIIHRDIKSSNIFITVNGQVKIMDFGLALSSERTVLTKSGAAVGTVPYMSPEQARGEKVDHRTDLWSLGVLLYEMIAGKHPFPGAYPEAVVYSILNSEPEPLTGIRTGVPLELENIVNKLMAKNRDERYRHADELATDLRRIRTAMQTGKTRTVQAAAPLSGRKRFVRSSLWVSLLIVIGLIAGMLFLQRSAMIPFAERDWILIADFDNHTGDELFDKSLNAAFSVSIEQSRYVNVFPQRRINETLQRMMKSDVRHIDDATAREIALREGINIILVPAISRIGERYVLTGTLQNPSTGVVYSSEMVYAQDLDNILNALDELGRKLRRRLGESRQAISRHSKPLVLVTTASLEALKQYSLGVESLIRTNFEDAKMYYENALRIDSSFTSAKASLGVLHFDNFDREKGKKLLSEVVGETDNVTEREKYDILSYYSAMVEEDLEEAVGYLRTQLALYPDHERAYHNLGVYYFRLGRYRESADAQRKALRLNPERMLTYDNLNRLYLYHLAELDSAIALCRQQISVNPNHTRAYENLGWAYLGKSNLNRAADAFEKALELNPRFILALYRLGHSFRMMERYEEALWPYRRIIELDPEEVWAHYQLGVVYQLMGNDEPARTSFERFRKSAEEWVREEPDNASGYIALGLVLTRLGRTEDGWSAGERAMELNPDLHFEIARLLAVQGRTEEALDRLERVTARGYLVWARTHPDLQLLYDEPRFTELINRVIQ